MLAHLVQSSAPFAHKSEMAINLPTERCLISEVRESNGAPGAGACPPHNPQVPAKLTF
jgi:hypothetical protein